MFSYLLGQVGINTTVWSYKLEIKKLEETSKDLVYSTGNSTQYSVITYMEKECEKEWIYVYV